MDEKRVIAKIQGNEYNLVGSVNQERMDKISSKVDHMINRVKSSNSVIQSKLIYIICCLNFADEILNLTEETEILTQEKEQLESRIDSMEDVKELKEELFTYKEYSKNNEELNNMIKMERDSAIEELSKTKELMEQFEKKLKQHKFDVEESRKVILELQNQLLESQTELDELKRKWR